MAKTKGRIGTLISSSLGQYLLELARLLIMPKDLTCEYAQKGLELRMKQCRDLMTQASVRIEYLENELAKLRSQLPPGEGTGGSGSTPEAEGK